MKGKAFLAVVLFVAVAFCGIYAMNEDADESSALTDGNWTFTVSGSDATLTKFNGSGATNLVVPSTVTSGGVTYTVTSIQGTSSSKPAVSNTALGTTCTLTLPSTLTSIGTNAFSGCTNFTGSLTIPDTVTSIGSSTFFKCSGFTGSLVIPDSVTSIGAGAFRSCSGFTGSLVIPDSVTSIGNYAFRDCSGFTGSLVIPDSVTRIGDSVFYKCSGFTGSLVIPDSVTSIGAGAFRDCSGFTGLLTIPNTVTSIGANAFNGCSGFTGSLIPDSVTSIGSSAFNGCTNLATIYNASSLSLTIGATSNGYVAYYATNVYTCHTLSIQSNDSTMGTVSDSKIYIVDGQTPVINDNVLTTSVPNQSCTATPTGSSQFGSWTGISDSTPVTSDTTVTAVFENSEFENSDCVVTFYVNNSNYGTVSESSLTVPVGTSVSISDNTIYIGSYTVTATPSPQTNTWTYSFDRWANVPNSITGDVNITAYFDQEVRLYTVDIVKPDYENYGTVTLQGTSTEIGQIAVPYGTTFTLSDNVLTVNASTGTIVLVATPFEDTAEFDYRFVSLSYPYPMVHEDGQKIVGRFARDVQSYSFTLYTIQNDWGTLTSNSYIPTTLHYGDVYSVNGNVLEIWKYYEIESPTPTFRITPVPASDTGQYHYSFDHWSFPSGTITGNSFNNAIFSRTTNQCTITFVANDPDWGTVFINSEYAVSNTLTVDYGTTYSVDDNTLVVGDVRISATPTNPTDQYDYSFSSWTPSTGTVTADMTITANFTRTVNQYLMYISANPSYMGSVSTDEVTVDYGTSYSTNGNILSIGSTTVTATPAVATAQEYYVFDRWADENYITTSSGTVTDTTHIYAIFTSVTQTYTVTFTASPNGYGSVSESSLTIPYGTPISSLDNPTLTLGSYTITATPSASDEYVYTFEYWTKTPGAGTTITQDTSFMAYFSQTVREYTITFVSEATTDSSIHNWGSIDYNTLTVPYGTSVSVYDNTVTIGSTLVTATPAQQTDYYTYSFVSWDTSGAYYIDQDFTFTAYFDRTDRLYTVTFQVNEPMWGSISITGGYGDESPNTILVGYNTPIVEQTFGTSFQSMLIFGNSSTVRGYSVYAQAEPSTPEYIYAFDHWSDSSGYVTQDMTITVYFSSTMATHTLTFVSNNSSWGSVSPSSVTVSYGTTYSASGDTMTVGSNTVTATPAYPTDEYTFSVGSWSSSSGTVTADATITVTFVATLNQYTVYFAPYDSTMGSVSQNSVTVNYGTTYSTNGNELSIGSDTITATPAQQTAQYTYTFREWSSSSGTITGETTIYADFNANIRSYTVTFAPSNSSYGSVDTNSVTVEYGSSVSANGSTLYVGSETIHATAEPQTAQYIYTFASWSKSSGTITGDTSITANFNRTVRQYDVHISVNDSSYGSVNESLVRVNYGTAISTLSNNRIRIGVTTVTPTPHATTDQYTYAFSSWSGLTATVIEDTYLTANFTATVREYTVSFVANYSTWGTISPTSVTVPYGTEFQANGNVMSFGVETVTATHSDSTAQYTYGFGDWNLSSGTVIQNLTITANFTRESNWYTITIAPNDSTYGSVSETSVEVPYGTSYSASGNTLTIGSTDSVATPADNTAQYTYGFTDWSVTVGTVTQSDTFYANFTRTVNQYTVTIVKSPDYGSISETSVTVDYGTSMSTSGNVLTIGETTVTATPDPSTAQYTYSFKQWNGVGTVTGTMTVTAVFQRTTNQYLVHFDVNDSEYGRIDSTSSAYWVYYGTTFSVSGNQITFSGHTVRAVASSATNEYTYSFTSWSGVPSSVTQETYITANFDRDIRLYTVTVYSSDTDAGTVSRRYVEVPYGTSYSSSDTTMTIGSETVTATVTEDTAQYDYEFVGWSPSSGTVTDNSTVITARFTTSVATYTVTFAVNNGEWGSVSVPTVTVPYGTTFTSSISLKAMFFTSSGSETIPNVIATPTEDTHYYDYEFAGWSPSSGTVSDNMTVTVNFTRTLIEYTVRFVPNDSDWGSVDVNSLTVLYGTTVSANGNILTINGTTVTATPTSDTIQYDYGFQSWSMTSGEITDDTTITATFTRDVKTYQVTITSSNPSWGTVDTDVLYVDYGTAVSVNDNLLFVGSNTVTATPHAETPQYRYAFDEWSMTSGEIVGNTAISASFERITIGYVVSFTSSNPSWGTVNTNSVTVPYDTPYTVSSNQITINGTTVTATAHADTAQYDYSFIGWSENSGTVTEDMIITANFDRNVIAYVVTITNTTPGWGSVDIDFVTVDYGTTVSADANVLRIGMTDITATPTMDTMQYQYDFGSWSMTSGQITGNTNINVTFTRTTLAYTVSITTNGLGTVNVQQVTVYYGTAITSSGNTVTIGETVVTATPAQDTVQYHYEFDSWNIPYESVIDDMVITARFTQSIINYTVTINSANPLWGSVSESSLLVPYGTVVSSNGDTLTVGTDNILATPTEETAQYTYGFDYWENGTGEITDNTIITAHFTRTVNNYTVTITVGTVGWGDVDEDEVYVPYGTIITADGNILTVGATDVTATPTQDTDQYDYGFDRWSVMDSETVVGDTEVTVYFSRTTISYTVMFTVGNPGWGTVDTGSVTVPYGTYFSTNSNTLTIDEYHVTATPTQDTAQYDYGFDRWSEDSGSIIGATTITAYFTRDVIAYNVHIVKNDDFGTIDETLLTVDYGTSMSASGNILSVGETDVTAQAYDSNAQYAYGFSGWLGVVPSVVSDVTVTAQFTRTVNQYTVTIQTSNDYGTVDTNSVTVDYGTSMGVSNNILNIGETTITATPNPATSVYEYDFVRWDGTSSSVIRDMVVTAVFERTYVKYTVTIQSNDTDCGNVNINSVRVEYGSPIYAEGNVLTVGETEVTARTYTDSAQYHYGFTGWSGIPQNGAVQADITVVANFTRTLLSYMVTITSSNTEYGTVTLDNTTVPYGTPFIQDGATLHIGDSTCTAIETQDTAQYTYTFQRWVGVPATVTGEVAIVADFTRVLNTYTVTFTVADGRGSWTVAEMLDVPYGTEVSLDGQTVTVGDMQSVFEATPDTPSMAYVLNGITVPSEMVEQDVTVSADVSVYHQMPAFNIIQPQYADIDIHKEEGPAWSLILVVPILVIVSLIVYAIRFGRGDGYNDF